MAQPRVKAAAAITTGANRTLPPNKGTPPVSRPQQLVQSNPVVGTYRNDSLTNHLMHLPSHKFGVPEEVNGIDRLVQWWFAGNHADIGGSYPEMESRLSDVALQWMIEQVTNIPNGLKIGPVVVKGEKLPGTGEVGTPLQLHPAADGLQHCEIAGTRDMLDAFAERLPGFMRGFVARLNYEEQVRKIDPKAPVHQTVRERFKLGFVLQCAGSGLYRPRALEHQDEFIAVPRRSIEERASP